MFFLIFQHEGLLPNQTPLRITNPTMRNWNTIHGFPIDKTSPRPNNRKNFFFLQNVEDVPKAIRQQFVNYYTNPSKYQLSSNPTLAEAISKFDQERPQDKMKYIKNHLPDLNFNTSLKSYF